MLYSKVNKCEIMQVHGPGPGAHWDFLGMGSLGHIRVQDTLAALGPQTHFHSCGLKAVELIWACDPCGSLGLNPFGPSAKCLFMFTGLELDNRVAIAGPHINIYIYCFICYYIYICVCVLFWIHNCECMGREPMGPISAWDPLGTFESSIHWLHLVLKPIFTALARKP